MNEEILNKIDEIDSHVKDIIKKHGSGHIRAEVDVINKLIEWRDRTLKGETVSEEEIKESRVGFIIVRTIEDLNLELADKMLEVKNYFVAISKN